MKIIIEKSDGLISADDLTDGNGIELVIRRESENGIIKEAFIYLTNQEADAFAILLSSMAV